MMKRIVMLMVLVLLISGCVKKAEAAQPSNEDRSILSKSIPSKVDGTIVDHLTRIEPVFIYDENGAVVDIEDGVYRLVILVDGVEDIYPVTAETWASTMTGSEVHLNCKVLPCTLREE